MTKYARIRDGFCTDVYRVPEDYGTFELLNKCLPGGGFIVVPDNTVHGAKDNGNGAYTNPTPPPPPPAPSVVYKKLHRGGRLQIMTDVFSDARQIAITAAFDALTDDVWVIRRRKFYSETYYITRDEMTQLFTAMRNADIPTGPTKITVSEIAAIAAHEAWLKGVENGA